MASRDHAGARELGAHRERVEVETHQIVDEQKQAADAGRKLTRREHEVVDVGYGLCVGPHQGGTFLVEPARQRREALLGQNLTHRGDAERHPLVLERLADLVDRIVAFAQRYDLLTGAALVGRLLRAGSAGCEQLRQVSVAECMTQHAEGAR